MSNLVSIIVPCYNQAQFLNATLQSVLDQSYSNWECVIVDDGSLDDTAFIAQKWIEKDSRFIYFFKKNEGVSSARNFALSKANGEYIQFLDSDDILEKKKIELSMKLIKESTNKSEKIVVSNFRMFVDTSSATSAPYCNLNKNLLNFESLLYSWNATFSIPIHCGFFETSLFKNIQFPEDMTAQEDWIVWVSIFKKGYKAIFLDEALALYRMNPNSRTNSRSLYEDQIKAFEYLRDIVSQEEFHKLSIELIFRYYKKNDFLKFQLRSIKNSNSYKTGLKIKKILKMFGILAILKRLLPFLLKFKS